MKERGWLDGRVLAVPPHRAHHDEDGRGDNNHEKDHQQETAWTKDRCDHGGSKVRSFFL